MKILEPQTLFCFMTISTIHCFTQTSYFEFLLLDKVLKRQREEHYLVLTAQGGVLKDNRFVCANQPKNI